MAEIVVDEIRGAEAEKQFSQLEDQAFSVPEGAHYLDDFPVWNSSLSPVGTIKRLGAFDGDKLVAVAGVRLAELRFSQAPVTVGLIGAVATRPEYRGRGLATQLVSLSVEWAAQRGAAAALLWGSEHQLYAKLGFAPCGTQAHLPLSSLLDLSASSANPSEKISMGWTPGLLAALKSRKDGLLVRDTDRGWLAAHRNVQWYWTGSPQKITAYAALGRGIDLPHFVHEWGGELSSLLAILRQVVKEDPQARLLGSPETFSRYGFQFDPSTEERLALVRVIDAMTLVKAVHPEIPFAAAFVGKDWKLSLIDSTGKTASASLAPLEMAMLFFGPLPEASKKPWTEIFPLPLWFWGLDAV